MFKRTFAAIALAATVFHALPANAGDPFDITLTDTTSGETRNFHFNNAEDAVNTFSNTKLSQYLSTYSPTHGVTAAVSLRGLPGTLSYAAGSNTLVLNIPSIGLTQNFVGTGGTTAAARNNAQDQLENFFKGQNGSAVLTQILRALAAKTPIDPVAGNPNSQLSLMGDRDFKLGTNYLEGFNYSANKDDRNHFETDVSGGRFSNDVSDQTVITAALNYNRRLTDSNVSLIFDLPFTYSDSEGASSYAASFGTGVRVPIMPNWAVTPLVRVAGVGSEDLGAAAVIYSGSVTSDFRVPLDNNNDFQLGNMIGYYKTNGITVGDYHIDYDLGNTRLKNGVALAHRFTPDKNALTGRVFFNDSRFYGDDLFNDYYEEVGVSLLQPYTVRTGLELTGSYLFADNYNGWRLSLDYNF